MVQNIYSSKNALEPMATVSSISRLMAIDMTFFMFGQ